MAMYAYRVARPDGTTLEGQTEGADPQAVRAHFESQGLLVFRLHPLGKTAWQAPSIFRGLQGRAQPSLQEFLVFNQEFLALVKAGLPILKTWDLLIDRTQRPGFQAALRAVRQDIRGGSALSDALARHAGLFSELYVASLKAAEHAGNLPEVLQHYIGYLKMMIGLRQKMIKALAYPAFLALAGVAVMAFMLVYVLPTFSGIYGEGGSGLPASTRTLIALVNGVQGSLGFVGVALLGGAVGLRLGLRTPRGRALRDRLLLALPLVGETLRRHYTVQLTRTLSVVLAGGMPVVQALQMAAGGVSNQVIGAGVRAAAHAVQEGATVAAALESVKGLPRMALEMIGVGEETGSLEAMLRNIAEFQEGELDQRLSQISTWIEPAMLLVMGVVVGAIVIIMYLPIFQMAGTVQ